MLYCNDYSNNLTSGEKKEKKLNAEEDLQIQQPTLVCFAKVTLRDFQKSNETENVSSADDQSPSYGILLHN